MQKKIHIVSFDNPYPANYGGAIDVYYKIKTLHSLGVKIILHVFATKNTEAHKELLKYTQEVFYYPKKTGILSHISYIPFRVKSRTNALLLERLQADAHPVLYEGLHSCATLSKIQGKKTFVRAHNIEHRYFYKLAKSEPSFIKKVAFYLDGYKQQLFEKKFYKLTGVFSISPFEQAYFKGKFKNKASYIPAFHNTESNSIPFSKNPFILYHGNLAVAENLQAALYLVDVYKNTSFKLVIAGNYQSPILLKQINKYANIIYTAIPTQKSLEQLFAQAHINALITFQNTGIKLKLLNALYKGKFVIANNAMVHQTGLEDTCEIANSKKEILEKTAFLLSKNFTKEQQKERLEILKQFSPNVSAKKLVALIFS